MEEGGKSGGTSKIEMGVRDAIGWKSAWAFEEVCIYVGAHRMRLTAVLETIYGHWTEIRCRAGRCLPDEGRVRDEECKLFSSSNHHMIEERIFAGVESAILHTILVD